MGRLQGDARQQPEEGRQQGRRDRPVAHRRDERGTGLLATSISVLAFLFLLLLAVQVVVALYSTSEVTAATYDGARILAGAGARGDPDAEARAADHVRQLLGPDRPGLVVHPPSTDDGWVVLTVEVDNPTFLPPDLRRPMQTDKITRTARVRIERAQP